jgi:hypothetical protein
MPFCLVSTMGLCAVNNGTVSSSMHDCLVVVAVAVAVAVLFLVGPNTYYTLYNVMVEDPE